MLRYHYFVIERDTRGNTHPVYDCYHLERAKKECNDLTLYGRHYGSMFYVATKVDQYELTRMESFVKLLYDTRELQREYFKGRDHETMLKAIALEARIDEWIARWSAYTSAHPDYRLPNERDQRLFEVVRQWRDTFKEWSRHKPKDDYKMRLRQECQGYETTIDNMIDYRLNNYREFK